MMYAQGDSPRPTGGTNCSDGLTKEAARDALAMNGGDVQAAINTLLGRRRGSIVNRCDV